MDVSFVPRTPSKLSAGLVSDITPIDQYVSEQEQQENLETSEELMEMEDIKSLYNREEDGEETILDGINLRDVDMVSSAELEDGKRQEDGLICNQTHSENVERKENSLLGDETGFEDKERKYKSLHVYQIGYEDEARRYNSLPNIKVVLNMRKAMEKHLLYIMEDQLLGLKMNKIRKNISIDNSDLKMTKRMKTLTTEKKMPIAMSK